MPKSRRQSGFSLLELLVVVIIIAIVVSMAVLSIGLVENDRGMRTEARRFASLVQLAQDEAMLQGRELGLEIMQTAYRFVEFDPFTNQWQPLLDDTPLKPRDLPEGLEFDLYLEGKRVMLEDDPVQLATGEEEDDRPMSESLKTYSPHLMILSSGDVTPFELSIRYPQNNLAIEVEGDLFGSIDVGSGEG